MRHLNYAQALEAAVFEEMQRNGKVYYMGEDVLNLGRERFFVAGDASLDAFAASCVTEACHGPVAAAFCNLYQLVSSNGQEFLRMLSPERIFLYHLPFSEDDQCGYHRLARQVLRKYPADLPPVERLAHMAWLDNQSAQWGNQKGDNFYGISGIDQHRPLLQSGAGGICV